MSTLTVEALENIAKLARQRIDAGLQHHGEQWRLGGRTGINFMMAKLRRLATPQPLKGDGDVPVQELIDQLQDACVTSDGTLLTDNAEPWGCDVGLLRKAIAALSALPQHPQAEPAARAQVAEYQVRPRSAKSDDSWRRVSKREFDDYGELPGFPDRDYERRKLFAHPSPAHAGAEAEALKLASKIGVFYHNGKVSLGSPLYAFTPDELTEFARRLAGADHA